MALLSLGHLLSEGFHPDRDAWVYEVPILASAIADSDFDTDGWHAEFHRIFIREVHPFANVFLSSDAQMGGLRTSWVKDDLQRMGLSIESTSSEPDHLGHLIITLGHLVGAEQDAVEDEIWNAIAGLRTLQAKWIDDHITPWLIPLQMAVQQQGPSLYVFVLELVAELVCSRRQRLELPYQPTRAFVLPPTIADLEHRQTDMRTIATQLITPALSGWYLSRGWISILGAQLDLPCGFGSRRLMMTNLLHTAIDHDAIPRLCEHLIGISDQWNTTFHDALQSQCPGWKEMAQGWIPRLETTRHLLTRLSEASVPSQYS